MINVRYRPVPAQAAIADKASKANNAGAFVDDETKEKLKEAASKAEALANDLCKASAEVAKAGLAGLKAGIEEAKKVYSNNKKN